MYEYPRSRCGLKPTSKQEITRTVTRTHNTFKEIDITKKFVGFQIKED